LQVLPSLANPQGGGAEDDTTRPAGTATNGIGASGIGDQSSAQGGDVARFHEAVAQRCLALTQQELEQHQGAEFDMAYMGQQIVAHVSMLAKLQASEQMASGELRQFVSQAIQTVEHHRQMAKDIKSALKQRDAAATPGATARGVGARSSR
jgi:hypothetical protein